MGNQVGRIRQAADLKVRYKVIGYENNCNLDFTLSDIDELPIIKPPEPGVETDEPPDSATLSAERCIERFEHNSVRVQCYCELIQHVFMHKVISKINLGPMQYIFGVSVCLSAIGGYTLNPVLIIAGPGLPLISTTQLYWLVMSIRDRHIRDFDIVKSGVVYIAGMGKSDSIDDMPIMITIITFIIAEFAFFGHVIKVQSLDFVDMTVRLALWVHLCIQTTNMLGDYISDLGLGLIMVVYLLAAISLTHYYRRSNREAVAEPCKIESVI